MAKPKLRFVRVEAGGGQSGGPSAAARAGEGSHAPSEL